MSYANKILLNGETLIDLTADTAVESDVAAGKTFHKADGSSAVGTASGGGGGECTLPHVIEVDTLPTENIDENAMYLCDGKYYKFSNEFIDVVAYMDGQIVSIKDEFGAYAEFNTIPTKTTNIPEGIFIYRFFYVEDEKNLYMYVADDGLVLASEAIGAPYGGTISNINEATTDGYMYALFGAWSEYAQVDGTLIITEPGTYDVTNKKSVDVDITIPVVNSGTLNIKGVPAGGARSWGETEYYHYFSLVSLPSQNITATLSTTETVYEADEGFVLKSVTVPAVDLSANKIPIGISIETYPKTEYVAGDWLKTDGGTFKVYYTNGETTIIELKPAHVSGFSSVRNSPGKHILRVIYTEGTYTYYATYQITVSEQ
jgi:hypothetical protein